jgi:hypothetical protein
VQNITKSFKILKGELCDLMTDKLDGDSDLLSVSILLQTNFIFMLFEQATFNELSRQNKDD